MQSNSRRQARHAPKDADMALGNRGILIAAALHQFVHMQLPPPEKVEVPVAGVTVPLMGDVGGRPLVDVTINGNGPYPFILDTGA